MLGLCFCASALPSCGKWGPLFIAVRGPLTTVASPVAEHRLQTRRLSSCGSRAQLLHGMWDLPRPGLEPVFPALAGRFSTTAQPGKPYFGFNISSFDCFSSLHNKVLAKKIQRPISNEQLRNKLVGIHSHKDMHSRSNANTHRHE